MRHWSCGRALLPIIVRRGSEAGQASIKTFEWTSLLTHLPNPPSSDMVHFPPPVGNITDDDLSRKDRLIEVSLPHMRSSTLSHLFGRSRSPPSAIAWNYFKRHQWDTVIIGSTIYAVERWGRLSFKFLNRLTGQSFIRSGCAKRTTRPRERATVHYPTRKRPLVILRHFNN